MSQDDDRLLADLAEAIRTAAEVPPRFIAAGKAAYSWRTVDAEIATLAGHPASDSALAGTRAEAAELRSLTFVSSRLAIEIEVTPEALLGQVVPPQPGRLEVRTAGGTTHTIDIDDVGWFAVRPVPAKMFRLHLYPADGPAVATEWFTL